MIIYGLMYNWQQLQESRMEVNTHFGPIQDKRNGLAQFATNGGDRPIFHNYNYVFADEFTDLLRFSWISIKNLVDLFINVSQIVANLKHNFSPSLTHELFAVFA